MTVFLVLYAIAGVALVFSLCCVSADCADSE
jgi:hypothetical protein